METNKILELLELNIKIIKTWQSEDNISQIEKQLVLRNQQEISDEILSSLAEKQPTEKTCKQEPEVEVIEQEQEEVAAVEQEQEQEVEIQEEVAHESQPEITPKPEPEPIQNKKLNHKVVLSLYDDSPQIEQPTEKLEEKLEGELEEVQPTQQAISESDSESDSEHKSLNDLLSNPVTTLSESLAHNINDLASSIEVSSITEMIGINDKFLLMRDLFYNNEVFYQNCIERLESFNSLDDALIYIYDNHKDWDSESAGAKFVIEILTRKLS